MAVVKTTRQGWLGLRRTVASGPSSKGTKAVFQMANDAFKKTGGAKPGLKRAVALHKASTFTAS
jgi:hypothetical protein